MATFAQRITMATDNTLTQRMTVAVILAALTVASEARPAQDAAQEEKTRANVRRTFARAVLMDPTTTVPRMRWVMACTPLADIPVPTDDDLLAAVLGVWDALSGGA